MASLDRHSQPSDGALGLVMLLVALILGVSWGLSLGIKLPDLGQVGQSLGLVAPTRQEVVQATNAAPGEPSAPHCAPGIAPTFVLGFADLKRAVGAPMGEPVECEHANAENGDVIQQTTTGLAYYRKATNTPTFTDGWNHWALTARGLVTWTGESVDPPEDSGGGRGGPPTGAPAQGQ